jgi:hypothetical protein
MNKSGRGLAPLAYPCAPRESERERSDRLTSPEQICRARSIGRFAPVLIRVVEIGRGQRGQATLPDLFISSFISLSACPMSRGCSSISQSGQTLKTAETLRTQRSAEKIRSSQLVILEKSCAGRGMTLKCSGHFSQFNNPSAVDPVFLSPPHGFSNCCLTFSNGRVRRIRPEPKDT